MVHVWVEMQVLWSLVEAELKSPSYFGVVVTKVVGILNHNVGFERLAFDHFHQLHGWVVDDWPSGLSHMPTSYFGGRGLAQIHIWDLDSSRNVLAGLMSEVGGQE